MKHIILIFALIVIVAGNIISIKIIESGQLNLNMLNSFTNASAEEVTTYSCSYSFWGQKLFICSEVDYSYCNYEEWDCWEDPYGFYSSDTSCSKVWCYDCETGLSGYQYNDCDI